VWISNTQSDELPKDPEPNAEGAGMSRTASPAATGERKTAPSITTRVAVLVAAVAATVVLPAGSASAEATFNQRILELVNTDRANAGLAPVVADPGLASVAEDAPFSLCGLLQPVLGRAMDMGVRNYFNHSILGCGLLGVSTLLNAAGINFSGSAENIAWMNGTTDPIVAANNLHSQWMDSDDHRKVILNPQWTRVGVGSWHTVGDDKWSGGGFPLTRVYIGVEVFAGGTPTTVAPPTTQPPTTTAPAGRFNPLTPARIVDTRNGTGLTGAVPPGGAVELQVTGRAGIPTSDVSAVAMTVTVTQPTAAGYVTLYPGGSSPPLAANVNFVAGETVSNLVVVKVGANGRVGLFNPNGSTHVVIDVAGWYSGAQTGAAGRFQPVTPSRILDTRDGTGGGVRLGPGASLDLQVTGRGGLPATGVQAATMNVTVTGTSSAGYLTVHPTGEARPLASTITFAQNATVAIRTMVKLGAGGKVTIFNGMGNTDVIVDVGGWFTDASTSGTLGAFVPVTPSRILDTRDNTGGVTGPVPAEGTVNVQVTGRGGVPATGVRAVVMNATVTATAGLGYMTIFPAGTARPLASDLNFAGGETQANLVVVQVGTAGQVSLASSVGAQVIFDVSGWTS
jgi:uncharacterized protein YkwD